MPAWPEAYHSPSQMDFNLRTVIRFYYRELGGSNALAGELKPGKRGMPSQIARPVVAQGLPVTGAIERVTSVMI